MICLGYKGYIIKEYFSNYFLHSSDVTIDARHKQVVYHSTTAEPWRVTLVDTGEASMTGGRLKRVASYLKPNEPFCFTYGDGVADVDIGRLVAFHRGHGRKATLTAVVPPGRYGALSLDGDRIEASSRNRRATRPSSTAAFSCSNLPLSSILPPTIPPGNSAPLERLAAEGQLMAYRHTGFWQPMDTMREKLHLEALWASGKAPWKRWT